MNLLALDSSSSLLSVAIQNGSVLREKSIPSPKSHVETLMPAVDQLFKETGSRPEEIGAFLVGRGPGSFTGLRVAFATLKAFKTIQKKDCYGALSLDIIAQNVESAGGSDLTVVLDARRDKLYARQYHRQKNQWLAKDKVQIWQLSELLNHLPAGSQITGDALERFHHAFENSGKNLRILGRDLWFPKASSLIRMFENKDQNLQALTKPADFIPLYFRLSEAEERIKQ